MKDWLKRRKHDMRRECSVFLVLVLVLTGIPFPVRAGKGQETGAGRMEGGLCMVCFIL